MFAYDRLRPVLFALDAERSHDLVLATMSLASRHPRLLAVLRRRFGDHVDSLPVEVMGLRFANPVGLAAGMDKQAAAGPAFCALGFGFVELGTVTPEPQDGNARPRMFRLAEDRAIINRMGFNSRGVDVFLRNLRRGRPPCIVGINIGKNARTPIERALDDYQIGLRAVYDDADYVSINISSPNTRDLRVLQEDAGLRGLLSGIRHCRSELRDQTGRNVPIAVKIAPDLGEEQVRGIARLCIEYGVDAIIATNTTTARPIPSNRRFAAESGGLSGEPLRESSTATVRQLCRALDGAMPVIAVGGIMSGSDAAEKIAAGASLVQLYTGLIYRGPDLVSESVRSLKELVDEAETN
jgi:dihydroorotate dehydrogenase